ncbi:MAG TPA: alpha-amylase family glycosyl hydrolase [Mobilitalea sp.]|nr:alpha-amylase family glycosyl hydrolase [Mobilitalea sp.]
MKNYCRLCISSLIFIGLIALTGCSGNTSEEDNNTLGIETVDDSRDVGQGENSGQEILEDSNTTNEKEDPSKNIESIIGGIDDKENTTTTEYKYNHELQLLDDNYRTYYEVFLYSFYDSNDDGVGDINGLIEKLDYINDGDSSTDTDLGFTGIWLMPIMPSNTYHKYDVKDYYSIDPVYGSIEDFNRLVVECDNRGIKLIIDLILNHSSQMHPWFLSALRSLPIEPCGEVKCTHEKLCREHNPYVKYYNFIEGKPDNGVYYSTGVGEWYYEGAFSSNMPDLNLADENLRRDIEDIMTYWLDLGVGGFRLDAALHYYTEDTARNTEVLTWLNSFNKEKNNQNYMVAEVWTNFSNYAKYYSSEIDSVFNFAFATESGKIVKTLNYSGVDNSAKAFGEAMLAVQKGLQKYSSTTIDAPFFTNHDTARAAGYFPGDLIKTKMAAGLNLMMSGNAFVYYGEELGMSGSGRDENKRAPMYWSETDSTGMTDGPENMETVTHQYGALEEQIGDTMSIYHYYKSAIRLRNENPEIARGEYALMSGFTDLDICAITKTYQGSTIILLYNISDAQKTITVSKADYSYEGIRGYLSTNGEEVLLEGENLLLPPYSIVILK